MSGHHQLSPGSAALLVLEYVIAVETVSASESVMVAIDGASATTFLNVPTEMNLIASTQYYSQTNSGQFTRTRESCVVMNVTREESYNLD